MPLPAHAYTYALSTEWEAPRGTDAIWPEYIDDGLSAEITLGYMEPYGHRDHSDSDTDESDDSDDDYPADNTDCDSDPDSEHEELADQSEEAAIWPEYTDHNHPIDTTEPWRTLDLSSDDGESDGDDIDPRTGSESREDVGGIFRSPIEPMVAMEIPRVSEINGSFNPAEPDNVSDTTDESDSRTMSPHQEEAPEQNGEDGVEHDSSTGVTETHQAPEHQSEEDGVEHGSSTGNTQTQGEPRVNHDHDDSNTVLPVDSISIGTESQPSEVIPENDQSGQDHCSICGEAYDTGSEAEIGVTLSCGHDFGSVCLARWLHVPGRGNGCPMCRKTLFVRTQGSYTHVGDVDDYLYDNDNDDDDDEYREIGDSEAYHAASLEYIGRLARAHRPITPLLDVNSLTSMSQRFHQRQRDIYTRLDETLAQEAQAATTPESRRHLELTRKMLGERRDEEARSRKRDINQSIKSALTAAVLTSPRLTVGFATRLQVATSVTESWVDDYLHESPGTWFAQARQGCSNLWNAFVAIRESPEGPGIDAPEEPDIETLYRADITPVEPVVTEIH